MWQGRLISVGDLPFSEENGRRSEWVVVGKRRRGGSGSSNRDVEQIIKNASKQTNNNSTLAGENTEKKLAGIYC